VTASPLPTRRATPAPTRADELRYLVERLVANHPEPFVGSTEAAFEVRIAKLAADADNLPLSEYLVELMRLFEGRGRDGHTGVLPFAQADEIVSAWPLALYEFEEGTYVVDAQPPYDDLIGSKVVAVGGRPLDEVVQLVAPLVAHDNAATVAARLPAYLVVPELLDGLGLRSDAGVTLQGPSGDVRDVSPDPIPMSEFRQWRGLFDPLVPPSLPPDQDGPLYLRNRGEHVWTTKVGDALYVGYNQVQALSPSGLSVSELAEQIAGEFAAGVVERVVVDVRSNPGGETGTYRLLRDALLDQAGRRPGSVVIIVGRSTFSAASTFITELRQEPGVRFVGETPGGSPMLYGDASIFGLPASGLRVHIAARYWALVPDEVGLAIEPDIVVPVRWSDYGAGVDPALVAALAE
jgi:hypothetical protein